MDGGKKKKIGEPRVALGGRRRIACEFWPSLPLSLSPHPDAPHRRRTTSFVRGDEAGYPLYELVVCTQDAVVIAFVDVQRRRRESCLVVQAERARDGDAVVLAAVHQQDGQPFEGDVSQAGCQVVPKAPLTVGGLRCNRGDAAYVEAFLKQPRGGADHNRTAHAPSDERNRDWRQPLRGQVAEEPADDQLELRHCRVDTFTRTTRSDWLTLRIVKKEHRGICCVRQMLRQAMVDAVPAKRAAATAAVRICGTRSAACAWTGHYEGFRPT